TPSYTKSVSWQHHHKTLSIYFSLFKAVCCFFIFAMHKKLSDSRALLLKLAEDKNTGCMPYS
ncbi:TPA: hypothetical protein ACPT1P_005423, partial [Klebsiella pneumoniae]